MVIDEGLLAWVVEALEPMGSVSMRSEQVAMPPGHGCAVPGTAHRLTMGGATLYSHACAGSDV